jgi:hypothetical protein
MRCLPWPPFSRYCLRIFWGYMRMAGTIFVSYARADSVFALGLAKRVTHSGGSSSRPAFLRPACRDWGPTDFTNVVIDFRVARDLE